MGSRPSPIGKISCQAQRGIALDARVDVCRAALGVAQKRPVSTTRALAKPSRRCWMASSAFRRMMEAGDHMHLWLGGA